MPVQIFMDDDHHEGEDPRLAFRSLRGAEDYPLLVEIIQSSRQADQYNEAISVESLESMFASFEHFIPERDVLIASLVNAPASVPPAVGYSRLGWYSSRTDNRIHYQVSFLRSDYRNQGLWRRMVRQNDRRMEKIAASQPAVAQCCLQAWATDKQPEWCTALESEGYRVARRFNNMLHDLAEIPSKPLPSGFEVSPVMPEHLRLIWQAQKEMNEGLFENVEEDWSEEKYPAWLEQASSTFSLWQVAWFGEEVAGMVLTHIDEEENSKRGQKRGHTEHIYVRPPWRQRGLASALIVRSLQNLKELGMQEAELGVDAENESAAFQLYQRLGYRTFSVDTWYRKSMT